MLYIVGTPIGNLDDISERCARTLREVDLIAAEDTRHSLRLLQRLELSKPMISYHEHNEAGRTPELIQKLQQGTNIALITDAGMPSISDPGRRLIAACIEAQLSYTVIPGPSAVLVALTGSGFQNDQWSFSGFLPNKSGQRERILADACETGDTAIFFESPHRITKTLAVLAQIAPTRRVCVARELTKQFEEFRVGLAADLLSHYEAHPAKGEITLLIDGFNRQEVKDQKRAERDARHDY
jgi:16S rRNA (cytidine1402-2'-O)-methyltransferase